MCALESIWLNEIEICVFWNVIFIWTKPYKRENV